MQSNQSTFLEIHFTILTTLAKLTNVHSNVSRCTRQKVYQNDVMNKVHSKTLLQDTLEYSLLHKLNSGVQSVKYISVYFDNKYTWMNIC